MTVENAENVVETDGHQDIKPNIIWYHSPSFSIDTTNTSLVFQNFSGHLLNLLFHLVNNCLKWIRMNECVWKWCELHNGQDRTWRPFECRLFVKQLKRSQWIVPTFFIRRSWGELKTCSQAIEQLSQSGLKFLNLVFTQTIERTPLVRAHVTWMHHQRGDFRF